MHNNGIVEDSCAPYVADGWYHGDRTCSSTSYCSYTLNSADDDEIEYISYENYNKFYVDEYGFIAGEENMIKALTEGPIVMYISYLYTEIADRIIIHVQ